MSDEPNLVAMTIEVVANYVAHNTIAPDDVPAFIAKTHGAIKALESAPAAAESADDAKSEFIPAVTARKSLSSRDHIISMIDGRPYKTLKRHLKGHGLTPTEYRQRYGLKPDYPMVAPAYSEHRREVAKTLGLGRKISGNQPAPGDEPAAADAPAKASAPPARAKATKVATKKSAAAATKMSPVPAAETPAAAPEPRASKAASKPASVDTAPVAKAKARSPKATKPAPAPDGETDVSTTPGAKTKKAAPRAKAATPAKAASKPRAKAKVGTPDAQTPPIVADQAPAGS